MYSTLIVLLLGFFITLYKWLTRNDSVFKKQGIPSEKPLPVIGNLWRLIAKKEGNCQFLERLYYKFGNSKYE